MLDHERAVLERYSAGARACESSLCCAADFDPALLAAIPREVIERDYGCGDPTRFLCAGETVVDLGSGSGKHCFIAAQIVGPAGKVIGVDMNPDMLALARSAAPVVAERIGYANVEFVEARIQAMGPAVPDGCADVVMSNCVLNLVRPDDKRALFDEIFRVLRDGGRAVISDIVSDRPVPAHMQEDPDLWSGCISGALHEPDLYAAFERAGFSSVEVVDRAEEPWRVVDGIAFRAVTVRANKGARRPAACCG
ncbi:MAG: methyltransferase domain-containing protein [Deltaproteobacteria bacterium]|nr:MAG: methyltransferase domain-containing protein [Deltaproteobacteria bacterium]